MAVTSKKRTGPRRAGRAGPVKSAIGKPKDTVAIHPGFATVLAAFVDDRSVSRRRMFSFENVLSANGQIFAMFVRGQLVAKLPKARVEELVQSGRAKHFELGTGRLMREWVAIEEGAVPWVLFAKEAYEFVWRRKR